MVWKTHNSAGDTMEEADEEDAGFHQPVRKMFVMSLI